MLDLRHSIHPKPTHAVHSHTEPWGNTAQSMVCWQGWPEVNSQPSVFSWALQTDPNSIGHTHPLGVKCTTFKTDLWKKNSYLCNLHHCPWDVFTAQKGKSSKYNTLKIISERFLVFWNTFPDIINFLQVFIYAAWIIKFIPPTTKNQWGNTDKQIEITMQRIHVDFIFIALKESNQTEFLRFPWQNKNAIFKVWNIFSVTLQFGSKW